jgi:hypothetical protein
MTDETYYLFFYHPKMKGHLLAELNEFYPKLRLSFSNSEFLSMKGSDNDFKELVKNPLCFSYKWRVFKEKSSTPSHHAVQLKDDEYWHYLPFEHYNQGEDLLPGTLPEKAPARAYLKAQEFFDSIIQQKPQGKVLECGAAPGGITYYLLNHGLKVTAVDPAIMKSSLSEEYPDQFNHLKESIFSIKKNNLPYDFDWLIFDLNLSAEVSIKEAKRFLSYCPGARAFITLKCPKAENTGKILRLIKKTFKSNETRCFHLPSHKNEFGLYIQKV